ncbi:hypothetical protein [Streptomonospora wellingtoniae]|uniref:Uncharacterized protein n=1 Tax=Streptomonospora wellingtoniae TaxID=3075544 RepID=A0ABU2KUL6_9ACTN|nr:hypothetical protein [Streptomonospora sp. DSM 45055]MDT0302952.1 hypothetical protein [Streptomonospora sp. DSM 45055]
MTATETGRTVTVALPRLPRLNSNQRMHWSVWRRRTRLIRETAAWVTTSLREAPMERAQITAVIHPKTNARFDPHNLQPTVKAAIDGIVDARLLADDDSKRVVSVAFVAGEKDPAGPRIDLIVTEVV